MPFLRPFFVLLVATAALRANESQALLRAAAESNVNQRYTIESVAIAGISADHSRVPETLRQRLLSLVGAHYDVSAIDELAAELRRDLHLKEVTGRVSRGSAPNCIRVNFETVRRALALDISVPRFLYHSSQGFSGEVDAGIQLKRSKSVTLGLGSNGNDFVERATGVTLRMEDASLAGGKVRVGLEMQAFHSQWNSMTLEALRAEGKESELYRARRTVSPAVTFELAGPLTVTVGASLGQMESWTGLPLRSANAITGDVRYRHAASHSTVEGRYSFRAGTRALGSDYAYSRHALNMIYRWKSGRRSAANEIAAGAIAGNAPLYEHFVLGSNSTLRGWNRYRIDPTGGSRMAHNSLSGGYRIGAGTVETFYDSGVLWHDGRQAQLRHSLGAGYRQGIFTFCVAFPLMDGRVAPVFVAGMNY